MMISNSKQRAYLKSLAMNETSVFQIGKSEVTPEVTESVSECFNNRTKYLSYAEKNISCSLFNTLNRKEDKPKDIIETLTKEENLDKKNVKIEEVNKETKERKNKRNLQFFYRRFVC